LNQRQRHREPEMEAVRIVEVGPRDGLQNEARLLPVAVKIELIRQLTDAGLRHVEAGAFVSAKRIPQMADSSAVFAGLRRAPGVVYSALVPNIEGFSAAQAAKADEVAVFASASESFSQRNIHCSVAESLRRFEPVMAAAREADVPVRGYISCVLGCPYEGAIAPAAVANVARALYAAGCYEIALGDTIGVGTPGGTKRLLQAVTEAVPIDALAGHFHDTYGQALANVYAALEAGVRVFDSSISGLGGCPYAPGALGNVATEDLLYLLDGLGLHTGVQMDGLLRAGAFVCGQLERPSASRVANALAARGAR
jgi:hydroxymethylglutaryl-CoA lyase